MSNLLKEKKGIGVIVCRMQVPFLTDSHKATINTVMERHSRIIMFLGCTNEPIDSKNPYPFEFRKEMLEAEYKIPNFTIIPLPDNSTDNAQWVATLDKFIDAFLAHDEEPILYGGRDSFIPWYKKDNGKYTATELAPTDYDSGTQLRELTAIKLPAYSRDAAQAILWTLKQAQEKW